MPEERITIVPESDKPVDFRPEISLSDKCDDMVWSATMMRGCNIILGAPLPGLQVPGCQVDVGMTDVANGAPLPGLQVHGPPTDVEAMQLPQQYRQQTSQLSTYQQMCKENGAPGTIMSTSALQGDCLKLPFSGLRRYQPVWPNLGFDMCSTPGIGVFPDN